MFGKQNRRIIHRLPETAHFTHLTYPCFICFFLWFVTFPEMYLHFLKINIIQVASSMD